MAAIKCYKCGSETKVSFTAPMQNLQWRRRWCLNKECGYRFSTYEVESTFLKRLIKRASTRYVQEGNFMLKIVDPEMQLPTQAKKTISQHKKFLQKEKKRIAQHEARKHHERLGPEEVQELLQKNKK
jgi:transcriptional regulator NrdR family protein